MDENDGHKKSVNFCQVEIIELPIILGDNPSISSGGPPMCVGWEPMRRSEFPIDFYEKHRPRRKRSRGGLIISGEGRTNFFLKCGYSLSEIERSTTLAHLYKQQMTISKILSDGPPSDRFSSACSRASTSANHDSLPTFRRRNSPTAEMVPVPPPASRVWTQDRKLQPLAQPRRVRSPSAGQDNSRKQPSRNKSMPTHFGIGSHRPNPQRRQSHVLPPPQPSRAFSPTNPSYRKEATDDHGLTPPRREVSPIVSDVRKSLERHNSMPSQFGRMTITQYGPPESAKESPPVQPCRAYSPTDVCRKSASDNNTLDRGMPLRKPSIAPTLGSPAAPGTSVPPPPAQPRRKRSPPLEVQKTLRRCT